MKRFDPELTQHQVVETLLSLQKFSNVCENREKSGATVAKIIQKREYFVSRNIARLKSGNVYSVVTKIS